jgi:hypothetical protein
VACGGQLVDGFADLNGPAKRSFAMPQQGLNACADGRAGSEWRPVSDAPTPAPSWLGSQSVLGRVQCRCCAGLRPSAAKDGPNGQLPAVSGGSAQQAPSRFSNACNTWTTSRAAFITPLHLFGRRRIRPHFIDQDVGLILVASIEHSWLLRGAAKPDG